MCVPLSRGSAIHERDARDWREKRDSRVSLFIWSIWSVWFNQTNERNQINKRDQPVLALVARHMEPIDSRRYER